MTLKTTKLRDAITFALVVGTTGFGGVVAAQETTTDATGATDLDRVEVTGSRIRQVETETAQPVLTIDRAQIEKQGFQSVADILQNLAASGSPTLSRSDVLASGESPGGSYIDLRNLGPQRTLVLINGKRMGINTDGFQDFASIPSSAVERVDVLKDGASSIYGSDAIAGVINVITRKNFNGAEANAYVGQYGQGDGNTQSYDFTIGATGERSSVVLSVQHVSEDPMWNRDRDFSAFGAGGPRHPQDGLTPVGQWGVLTNGPEQADGNTFYTVDRGGNPADFNDFHATAFPDDYSNPAEQVMLRSGMERTSVYGAARFDITDNVNFNADILYNKRDTEIQVAGYPISDPSYATMSVDSYYNPLGSKNGYAAPQEAQFYRRGWEVPRHSNNLLSTYRFTGGFEGTFNFGDDRYVDWDVGYLYNKNDGTQRGTGNLSIAAIQNAVGPSFMDTDGVVKCGAAGAVIDGCVPWNPLASFGSNAAGSLGDPNVQKYLYVIGQATAESKTESYTANVSTALAKLPAGDLGVAAGFEHRKESARFTPDAFSVSGGSTDLAAGETLGGYSLDEFYLEVQVPVLADLPFAKELSFDAAARYSDYSNFGDTVNSKFGLKWRPFDDLLVRGTYAEGFRAPVVSDLFGGVSDTFDSYTDPCDSLFGNATQNPATAARCAQDVPEGYRQVAQGGVPARQPNSQSNQPFSAGSNPNLGPETAKNKTLGFVYSPSYADGLNVSLDWWKIKIENTIIGESATTILNDCYVRGIDARCDLFERNDAGEVVSLNRNLVNAGFQETEGYDLGVRYRIPETSFGQFTVDWQSTYVSAFTTKADNEAATPVSQVNGFGGGNFRLRSNLSLDWSLGDFGITYGARYFSNIKEACAYDLDGGPECNIPDYAAPDTGPVPTRVVGSNTFHDIQFRVNTPWNATVAVGANNVFDHEGPILYSAPNSYNPYYGGFDIGRFMYMKYTQRF